MNEQVIQEVVNMIRPLILELVEMDVHQAITTLLYRFRDLLQRNDGRYLKYASYAVYLSPQQHLGPVNRVLTELLLQYLMRHPNMGRKGNIPTMSYIVITGGVYTVIRYLGEENPPISFDQLVEGLANMVTQLAGRDSRKGNAR
jgi:hypothetical protein